MKNSLLLSLLLSLFLCSCQSPKETKVTHYLSEEMAPLGLPFSDAVIVDNMIYVSGQVGNVPGKLELVPGGIAAETRQTLDNIKAVLEANGSSLDHAVKLTVMMADIGEWGAMNEIYKTYFPGKKPARAAFGANGLALDARLEIDCIAYIPSGE